MSPASTPPPLQPPPCPASCWTTSTAHDTCGPIATLQDPLYVRLDKPSEQIKECDEREMALGLNEGAAELFLHFGSDELKATFMQCL